MNAPCASNDERPTTEELLLQLERECQNVIPAATLALLLEPLRALVAIASDERDELQVEAALNRFEDVLEAFLLREAPTSS
ncbi:MAG TPA: hypothetical protein VIV60_27080 [Polyangiaceae bacterium]